MTHHPGGSTIPDHRTPNLFAQSDAIASDQLDFPIALLALGRVKGLGVKSLQKIVKEVGTDLGRVLTNPKDLLPSISGLGGGITDLIATAVTQDYQRVVDEAADELERLNRRGVHILSPQNLPSQMRGRPDSPQWLFVEGNPSALLNQVLVGVIGTRTPTAMGLQYTRLVARILSGYDVTVVSGLAEGIDDEIHRQSMDRKLINVAFLGHGINSVFPASTASTRERIVAAGGAVATEHFPNEKFQKSFFVQRNRLQALLSNLLIFVEAKEKSGTAHTLDFAMKYQRKVVGIKAAVPGIDQSIKDLQCPVVDLASKTGARRLDGIIRASIGGNAIRNKVIAQIVRSLEAELSLRDLTPLEVDNLVSRMTASIYYSAGKSSEDA